MSRVPRASGDKPNAGKLKNKMSVCVAMKGKDKKTAPPLVNQTIFFDTKNSDVESFKKLPSGNQYCPQERIKSGLKYGQSKLAALLSEAGNSPVVIDTVNEPEVTQQEVDEAMEAELARQAAAQAAPMEHLDKVVPF